MYKFKIFYMIKNISGQEQPDVDSLGTEGLDRRQALVQQVVFFRQIVCYNYLAFILMFASCGVTGRVENVPKGNYANGVVKVQIGETHKTIMTNVYVHDVKVKENDIVKIKRNKLTKIKKP